MYIEHACLVLSKRLHLQTIFLTQQNKLRITACFFLSAQVAICSDLARYNTDSSFLSGMR